MAELSPAAALWFLLRCSWKNRLLGAFRRLRQPKYLFGLLVAVAYFVLVFGGPALSSRDPRGGAALPALPLFDSFAAIGLFFFAVVLWVTPTRGAALLFSPPEIDFLFPAPLSRKNLVRYALLKAQIPILFTSALLALFSRGRLTGHPVLFALGAWAAFSVMQLYGTAVGCARALLREKGWGGFPRFLVAGLVLGIFALVAWVQGRSLASGFPPAGGIEGLDPVRRLLESGPLAWLLLPFRAVIRPVFSVSAGAFLLSVPWTLAIATVLYAWIVRADVAIEEASVEASERIARLVEARRRGGLFTGRGLPKPERRNPPFRLRPSGPPFVALLWKNLIVAGRFYSARNLALALAGAAVLGAVLARTPEPFVHLGLVVAFMAGALAFGMTLSGGPRVDLRVSLQDSSVLKTLPLPGWKIVLGETLAPALLCSCWLWTGLAYATGFVASHPDYRLTPLEAACAALAAVFLAFPISYLSTLVQNGAALYFPGWGLLGRLPQRGIAAMGQRILMFALMFGILIAVVLPAAGIFLLVGGILRALTGAFLPWTPLAALVAILPLLAEAAGILYLLGRAFDRFDPSRELEGG